MHDQHGKGFLIFNFKFNKIYSLFKSHFHHYGKRQKSSVSDLSQDVTPCSVKFLKFDGLLPVSSEGTFIKYHMKTKTWGTKFATEFWSIWTFMRGMGI